MPKQVNISFKDNDKEKELYDWVKSKLSPGTYIKELLYTSYLAEKNGVNLTLIPRPTGETQSNSVIEEIQDVDTKETNLDEGEWGI